MDKKICCDKQNFEPVQPELELLVPEAPGMVVKGTVTSSLETLEGKSIGLFWNGKPNGDVFLKKAGELLKTRFKNIKLIEYMPGKVDSTSGANPANLRKVAQECDLVLLSLGD